MSPAITEIGVSRTRPEEPRSPSELRKSTTALWSERIVCHARVRIRYVVKNGAITQKSRTLRQRPERSAIT